MALLRPNYHRPHPYLMTPPPLANAVRPGPVQQFTDYAGFLAMNALVGAMETWRQFQRFLATEWFGGAIFGAVATVYIVIVGGGV
jgi:hypothetical protein